MTEPVLIFTDGSSRGNPGPGGWGAIVADNDVAELGGREDRTTNNRMELTAAIEALAFFDLEFEDKQNMPIVISTDSQYLINGITKWVAGWEKNGWKTAAKKAVENQDLWERLTRVSKGKDIEWKYVEGHAGHPANERCDEIATRFADKKPPQLFSGSKQDYFVDISLTPLTLAIKSPKKKSSSSKKAYSYLSLVDGKAARHETWAECEKRVKGISGAKWKKTGNKMEENEILRDWGATL